MPGGVEGEAAADSPSIRPRLRASDPSPTKWRNRAADATNLNWAPPGDEARDAASFAFHLPNQRSGTGITRTRENGGRGRSAVS